MYEFLKNSLRFVSLDVGPNFQIDDGFVALKQLLFGRWISNTHSKQYCENWFNDYLKQTEDPNFRAYFTTNARHGLYLLLKTLDLPKDSEVLVQGFSCIVVPNAVLQANLVPTTCDISAKTFNFDLDAVEKYITKKTKVWIIQHNMGLVMNMTKVQQIAERNNLILIEDCAHSLGGMHDGKPVGCFGDAAIFSFGRDKIISTTNGGVVTFNPQQRAWQNNFENEYKNLNQVNQKQTDENLLYPVLVVFFIRPLYRLLLGKIVAVLNLRLRLTGEVYTNGEKSAEVFVTATQYSNQLYPLLANQLKKVTVLNDHRKKLATIYAQYFGVEYGPNSVYLRFPLYLKSVTKSEKVDFNSTRYDQIMIKAKSLGIYLGSWYTQTFVGSNQSEHDNSYLFTPDTTPTTAKLIQHQVINLPTNIHTSVDEARLICKVITHAR